jgi:hypothetical protein
LREAGLGHKRRGTALALASLLTTAAFPAVLGGAPQSSDASGSGGLKVSNRSVSAAGCIQSVDPTSAKYSLTDQKRGITYFLSGKDVSAYEGKKVRIVGGLLPTPNVAAQGSAIDPGKAVLETRGHGLAGTGNVRLEDLLVSSIKPMKGACSAR